MKRILLLVFVALVIIAGVVIVKLRIDAQNQVEQLKQETSDIQRKHDQGLQEIQSRVVAWRYCQSNPPTTAEHKAQCQKLDEWAHANAGSEKW